jgi:hypothetical protein
MEIALNIPAFGSLVAGVPGILLLFRKPVRSDRVLLPLRGFVSSPAALDRVRAGTRGDFSQATRFPLHLPRIEQPTSPRGIFH